MTDCPCNIHESLVFFAQRSNSESLFFKAKSIVGKEFSMTVKFEDPLDKFIVKHLLIVSADDAATARISLFAAQLKGSHGDQIVAANVDTIRRARDYVKANPSLNIILIDPSVASARSVLNFVKEIRENQKHIVWVVLGAKIWWEQNKKILQKHPWGRRFSKYYRLPKKDISGEQAYRNFVFVLTACHWDFVLQLISDAAGRIQQDASVFMTPEQVKKFIEKGMAPLQSLSKEQSRKNRDAFVSMPQSAPFPAQYKMAIEQPLRAAGYNPVFMGDAQVSGQIHDEIFSRIRGCSLFIADVTNMRHSVLIEIGYALAMDIPRIVMRSEEVKDGDLPFLLQGIQIARYVTFEGLKDHLTRELRNLDKST